MRVCFFEDTRFLLYSSLEIESYRMTFLFLLKCLCVQTHLQCLLAVKMTERADILALSDITHKYDVYIINTKHIELTLSNAHVSFVVFQSIVIVN